MSDQTVAIALSSRAGFSVTELGRLSSEAEEAGFDGVHVSERSSDAVALAQVVASATQRIQIATSIANIHLRHPGHMALAVATVDEVSAGRFVLGLGTGNPQYNREVLGLDPPPALTAMEEYVAVLRAALSGDPVDFEGNAYQLRGFDLHRPPLRRNVPIRIGAMLPRMLALAGRVADGAVFALQSPARARESAQAVHRAARGAGRDPGSVDISCLIPCCASDDPQVALRSAKAVVAGYALHPSAGQLFDEMGHGGALEAVADAMRRGDADAAAQHVPAQLAEQLVVHGDSDRCNAQLDEFRAAGVRTPILLPMPLADSGWMSSVENALRAFAS